MSISLSKSNSIGTTRTCLGEESSDHHWQSDPFKMICAKKVQIACTWHENYTGLDKKFNACSRSHWHTKEHTTTEILVEFCAPIRCHGNANQNEFAKIKQKDTCSIKPLFVLIWTAQMTNNANGPDSQSKSLINLEMLSCRQREIASHCKKEKGLLFFDIWQTSLGKGFISDFHL